MITYWWRIPLQFYLGLSEENRASEILGAQDYNWATPFLCISYSSNHLADISPKQGASMLQEYLPPSWVICYMFRPFVPFILFFYVFYLAKLFKVFLVFGSIRLCNLCLLCCFIFHLQRITCLIFALLIYNKTNPIKEKCLIILSKSQFTNNQCNLKLKNCKFRLGTPCLFCF